MKKHILTAATVLILVAVPLTAAAAWMHEHPVVKVEQLPAPADPLSFPQRAWLGALEWCESNGSPAAVNPKDVDDTPSYGILQFKPSTLEEYAKKYGITGALMNPDTQEKIVEHMILDTGITAKQWRHSLFPVCVSKLGSPPRLST